MMMMIWPRGNVSNLLELTSTLSSWIVPSPSNSLLPKKLLIVLSFVDDLGVTSGGIASINVCINIARFNISASSCVSRSENSFHCWWSCRALYAFFRRAARCNLLTASSTIRLTFKSLDSSMKPATTSSSSSSSSSLLLLFPIIIMGWWCSIEFVSTPVDPPPPPPSLPLESSPLFGL